MYMVHRTCTCTNDIGAGTSTLPRVGPKDFDQWINNEACGAWRFFMMKNEPSVILYPTTMTRVPENLDAWRDYKSDAHYPMSFKLAPPQERKQQQIVDMTLAAMHPNPNQLGDGAASPVAEASPKPAQPQPPPPPPTRNDHRDLAAEQQPAKRRSVGTPGKQAPARSLPPPPQQQAPARSLPPPAQPMKASVLPPPPPPRNPKMEVEPTQSQQQSPQPSPGTSSSAEPAASPPGPRVVEPPPAMGHGAWALQGHGVWALLNVEVAAKDSTTRARGIPVSSVTVKSDPVAGGVESAAGHSRVESRTQ